MEELKIRYNLVKEDGTTHGNNSFDTNADWLEVWLVQYKNETCVVDSQGNIILMGGRCNDQGWFTLEEHNIELEQYPVFLDRLTNFIDYVNQNEKPYVDGRCILFDLLCHSQHIKSIEKFVYAAEIPLEYYDSYCEEMKTFHTLNQ